MFNSLNLELSSKCNKSCWMCGWNGDGGDMEFSLIEKIASQLPAGIVVQFHNRGESLLHPRFGEAVALFDRQIKCVNTNAKLIVKKADEIIGNLDTITFSIFEGDTEWEEQDHLIKEFLFLKGDRKPNVIYRVMGNVDRKYDGLVARRAIHDAAASKNYTRPVVIPEIGVCLDLLSHMAINRKGDVSICVRQDPEGLGVIGDANREDLNDIWECKARMDLIQQHLKGRREGLCSTCGYWGVPV